MKTKGIKRSKNKIADWNNHLDKKYGKVRTADRTEFEAKDHAFVMITPFKNNLMS